MNIQHKLPTQTTSSQENSDQNVDTDVSKISRQELAETIAQDLIENKNIEIEFNKQEIVKSRSENNLDENLNEDTSLHKFLSVQFNHYVTCQICNKKVLYFSRKIFFFVKND